ncbi:Fur family transcriptional regulator [Defluviitalea phaphyphila]|uniref:Fur family transcriptional regulator n=1 Tax=Defluviitalea phaphyphila TaxID=1473580 RepID=UPI000731949F|nr:Fur family transcriptional regulator [Defluviitalea phaphyphila]
MNLNEIKKNLKSKGYKLTNQRKAILDVLIDYKGHILSAEQIYEKTKKIYSKTNFSTIYRNLEILERTQIIHKINISGEASKYKLVCHKGHHHHFICKSCGKSEIIDFCPLENLELELKNKDFVLTDHNFELYGYCKECIKAKKEGKD